MSFGFSPSDVVAVVAIVVRAYRSWDRACGEYSDITVSLNEIRVLLLRIQRESRSEGSVIVRDIGDAAQLRTILSGVRKTAEELDNIINRFERLRPGKSRERNWKRVRRNWDRLRFGNINLDGIRARLSQHVGTITGYLEAVGLASLARIEQDVRALPELMQRTMHDMRTEILAGTREGTILTEWSQDDPYMWKDFRRELLGEGFTMAEIQRNKPRIKQCLRRWAEERDLQGEGSEVETVENEVDSDIDGPFANDLAERDKDVAASLPQGDPRTTLNSRAFSSKSQAAIQGQTVPFPSRVEIETEITSTDGHEAPFRQESVHNSKRGPSACPTDDTDVATAVDGSQNFKDIESTVAIMTPSSKSPVEHQDPDEIVYTVTRVPESYHRLTLNQSGTVIGDLAFCTVFVVVPSEHVQLFCEFATDATPLLPILGQRLRDEGEFQSFVVMGMERLVELATQDLPLADLATSGEDVGQINGARIYLHHVQSSLRNWIPTPQPLRKPRRSRAMEI